MNQKFSRSWEGPYTIKYRISDLTYEITRSPLGVTKFVHHNLLRPYFGKTGTHWSTAKSLKELSRFFYNKCKSTQEIFVYCFEISYRCTYFCSTLTSTVVFALEDLCPGVSLAVISMRCMGICWNVVCADSSYLPPVNFYGSAYKEEAPWQAH